MAYPVCKIKRVAANTGILHGLQMSQNDIHTIQDADRIDWANDPKVLSAIDDEDYEIHDGSGIIGGVLATTALQKAHLQNY